MRAGRAAADDDDVGVGGGGVVCHGVLATPNAVGAKPQAETGATISSNSTAGWLSQWM